jgi:poly(hydroxyalkanoate) depolymerase family esterase
VHGFRAAFRPIVRSLPLAGWVVEMSTDPQAEMLEATRLTRAGRLTEATALLQHKLAGMLRRDAASDTAGRRHMPEVLGSLYGRLGPIVRGRAPLGTPAYDLRPEGGQFLARTYANQAGSRDYRLYVPTGYRGTPIPLIVMLHGCKQSPEDFAAGTGMNAHAEQRTCFVAYPGQTPAANSSQCWNWFDPRHQQRGRGEASLIAGITGEMLRNFSVDARRVYVAGLSAGGAAAAIIAATYPDLYAAVGVHSGLAGGAAHDVASAFAAMRQGTGAAETTSTPRRPDMPRAIVPTIVFHGDRDKIVHPRNAERVLVQFGGGTQLRREVQHGQVPGGHAYTRTLYYADASGQAMLEAWTVHGASHAWSGGNPRGSYTDPQGPDAAKEMLRFFLDHPRRSWPS